MSYVNFNRALSRAQIEALTNATNGKIYFATDGGIYVGGADGRAHFKSVDINTFLKADKVSGATAGHLAGLDANGNLTDSGKNASDVTTAYSHATDPYRLTTPQTSGFYKFSVTSEGHVGGVTSVVASDLTNLIGSTTYAPYNSAGYLPLSGGNMSGVIYMPANYQVQWGNTSMVYGDGSQLNLVSTGDNLYHVINGVSSYKILDTNNYSSYALPLTGGVITGQITRDSGGGWITGRDHAIIKTTRTSAAGNDWHPAVAVKTSVGCWTFGSVGGETLAISYDTDADYDAGSNQNSPIYFPDAGSTGTLALTSQIPTNNNQLTNGAGYITSSALSSYLPLSGGTMTGRIYAANNVFDTLLGSNDGVGALDLSNSDITGVNAITTSDASESWTESLAFKRNNNNWDTIRACDGTFYIGLNMNAGSGTEYTLLHTGNIGSQSVAYASSAGSVVWANVIGHPPLNIIDLR